MSKRRTSTQPSPSAKEHCTTTQSLCSLTSPRSELGAMLEFLQGRAAARASRETAWQRRHAPVRQPKVSLYLPRAGLDTVAIGTRHSSYRAKKLHAPDRAAGALIMNQRQSAPGTVTTPCVSQVICSNRVMCALPATYPLPLSIQSC